MTERTYIRIEDIPMWGKEGRVPRWIGQLADWKAIPPGHGLEVELDGGGANNFCITFRKSPRTKGLGLIAVCRGERAWVARPQEDGDGAST